MQRKLYFIRGCFVFNFLWVIFKYIAAVLKDVPNSPHQMIKDPSQDHIRMSAYPNLEYGNLYNAIAMLLDVAPNIQFGLNGEQIKAFAPSTVH